MEKEFLNAVECADCYSPNVYVEIQNHLIGGNWMKVEVAVCNGCLGSNIVRYTPPKVIN